MSAIPGPFGLPRIITFVASLTATLAGGSNYVFSAYAPQLGERLNITHTKLNVIGLAGNVGVYSTAPIWGRLVDIRGPKLALALGFILLFVGYSGIRFIYDGGLDPDQTTVTTFTFIIMVLFGYMTGAGGNGGCSAAINATAKTFPEKLRASATGIVMSGFGLSAFVFSTLAHFVFPGDTSTFLIVLALGTSLPMIAGFFLIRPIPLPPTETTTRRRRDSSEPLLSERPNFDREIEDVAVDGQEESPATKVHTTDNHLEHPNIYGLELWKNIDFWLLFLILTFVSGTGLMFINNVGAMARALYIHATPVFSEIEVVEWQAAQVSTISISNCLGRIFIGLFADFSKHHFHLPRSHMLIVASGLALISQIIAASIGVIENLWIASVALGVAYGCTFGIFPSLCIDWFGLSHFSENWGYVSLAPVIGGNLFSLAFGRNLDAHQPSAESLVKYCMEGKFCYVESLYLTMGGCATALLLSVYASWRERKIRQHVHRVVE
ncbi:MFS general substrate transporter [Cylindrobasidium torrendii FP15055 ss-10]|uniref:MFS general substrate transporter n=1 Tax=Cylindrobasidium torrendii FP15055 ss-10 TaxID=1314674 RepID=A0A0D7AZ50_9AGAR|nr:MFS general substrate transporter [Cylindrobasidium torrendii FP15055 ss-10]